MGICEAPKSPETKHVLFFVVGVWKASLNSNKRENMLSILWSYVVIQNSCCMIFGVSVITILASAFLIQCAQTLTQIYGEGLFIYKIIEGYLESI